MAEMKLVASLEKRGCLWEVYETPANGTYVKYIGRGRSLRKEWVDSSFAPSEWVGKHEFKDEFRRYE